MSAITADEVVLHGHRVRFHSSGDGPAARAPPRHREHRRHVVAGRRRPRRRAHGHRARPARPRRTRPSRAATTRSAPTRAASATSSRRSATTAPRSSATRSAAGSRCSSPTSSPSASSASCSSRAAASAARSTRSSAPRRCPARRSCSRCSAGAWLRTTGGAVGATLAPPRPAHRRGPGRASRPASRRSPTPSARGAFVHTARAAIDAGGQRVVGDRPPLPRRHAPDAASSGASATRSSRPTHGARRARRDPRQPPRDLRRCRALPAPRAPGPLRLGARGLRAHHRAGANRRRGVERAAARGRLTPAALALRAPAKHPSGWRRTAPTAAFSPARPATSSACRARPSASGRGAGYIRASRSTGDPHVYCLEDVAEAWVVHALLERGVGHAAVRRMIAALGDERRWPLLGVPLATTDGDAPPRVVLCSPDGVFALSVPRVAAPRGPAAAARPCARRARSGCSSPRRARTAATNGR